MPWRVMSVGPDDSVTTHDTTTRCFLGGATISIFATNAYQYSHLTLVSRSVSDGYS